MAVTYYVALPFIRTDDGTACSFTRLMQFPAYLNRWDSQQARNEGVFAH